MRTCKRPSPLFVCVCEGIGTRREGLSMDAYPRAPGGGYRTTRFWPLLLVQGAGPSLLRPHLQFIRLRGAISYQLPPDPKVSYKERRSSTTLVKVGEAPYSSRVQSASAHFCAADWTASVGDRGSRCRAKGPQTTLHPPPIATLSRNSHRYSMEWPRVVACCSCTLNL